MEKRSIVLLATDCDTTRIVYHYLSGTVNIERVIIEEEVSKAFLIRRRIKNLGLWKVFGQLLFMVLVSPLLRKQGLVRAAAIRREYGLQDGPIPESVITRVASVNTDACRELLATLAPDAVLVNGTRIIGKKTLTACKAPFINVHTGITPMFRGVHGGYWAIARRRPELFGTTVHQVDTGIDTGSVITQVTGRPEPEDNFSTYPLLQYALVLPHLKAVILSCLEGHPIPVTPPLVSESQLCYHPTIREYFTHPRKAGRS